MDARQRFLPEIQARRMFANRAPNWFGRITVRVAEEISAKVQADIVRGRKLSKVSREQHIPGFPRRPFEDGQEIKTSLVWQRQGLMQVRIILSFINSFRNDNEF